jgi:hypothetical protein
LKLPLTGSSAGIVFGGASQWYDDIGDMRTPDALRVDTHMAIGTELKDSYGLRIFQTWSDARASGTGLEVTAYGQQTGVNPVVTGIIGLARADTSNKPARLGCLDFEALLEGTVGATEWFGCRVTLSSDGTGAVDDAYGYLIQTSWIGTHTLDRFRGFHCPDLTARATDAASDIFGFQADAFDASATPNRYPFFYGDVGTPLWYVDAAGDMLLATNKFLQFRDSGLRIQSFVDGQLNIAADTKLVITAPAVTMSGTLEVGAVQTYTESNVTTDRSFDADATSIHELADVLGTLIADLRTIGLVN